MVGGNWSSWLLLLVILVSGWAYFPVSVNGWPMEDLVVSLPGQPKVGFRQFAGYVDVDVKAGRSLFYYFVEAEKDPLLKPLSLWLNGGPGCSSLGGGAFTELGPFFPRGDGRGLVKNSKSWNKASNMLFIESPAGVGWSYSNTSSDYNTGDAKTANDMRTFLLKWYEKFPELRSLDFFLTGESYAGHYIPQLAVALLDYNAKSTGFKFNIKGVAIGNPLLKLDRDVPATYEYFWSHGMISDEIGLTIMNDCDFEDYTFGSPHNVSSSCNNAISTANQIVGDYVNNYDVILDVCYPSIVEQELRLKKAVTKMSLGVDVCMTEERHFYFNLPEVQIALHANRTNLPYKWSMCSGLLNYSDTDGNINILPLLERIIHNHIPVWIFSGDQDSVVPLLGSRTLVRELAHDLKLNTTVPYGAWFHKSQVGGWAVEYGNILTFATVRGAAHMVPYAQPSRALQLFSDFVRGRRLPNTTHTSADIHQTHNNKMMASQQKYAYPFPPFLPHPASPPPPSPPPHSPPPSPSPPPHSPSPPPPPHSPPPHPILPPPSPPPRHRPVLPPPSPPKPHPLAPPPPYLPPPSPPHHHPTIIVIVVVSFGSLLLLAALFFGFCCVMKKRKKIVKKTQDIDIEGHIKVHEIVVPGPHGPRIEMLDVKGDVEVHDHVRKSEIKVGKGLHSDQAAALESEEEGDHFHEAEGTSTPQDHNHESQPKV
ncbi:hypothetical protein V2J09_007663 [Rumex salicifolius]